MIAASVIIVLCMQVSGILSTYDLIDATPRCYTTGYCEDYGEWGTYSSIHPNSEEKTQRTLINLARMYPTDYQSSPYGSNIYGTYGGSWEYDSEGDCGIAADVPYYWQSDANQASRFGSWNCLDCDSSCGHSTCSDPDYCTEYFDGDCGFSARCQAFMDDTYSMWCSAEGLCGANMCYTDGHCSAMFNPDSNIFGIGFEPGSNGIVISYINPGSYEIDYSIPNVCHFDERIKMNSADLDSNGNYLSFLLQYFNNDDSASKVYVAYDGQLNEMDLAYGTSNNGFYKLNMAIPDHCEPYYFIVETSSNDYVRMPESTDFMYGTAWSNWSWWAPDGTGSTPNRCEENHYYLYNDMWVANGGEDVGITTDSGCAGCGNTYTIASLWDSTSTGGDDDDGDDDDAVDTPSPTTPAPTADPTKYVCNDGCEINSGYVSDRYCDCSQCEDEDDWTCDTCGNADGHTCDDINNCNGFYMYCDAETPAPTDGGNDISTTTTTSTTTAAPTESTCDSSTQFCCNDGCGIPTYYQNDGSYCDCSECEDEDNWDCDTCDGWASYGYDCSYVGNSCGNWIYCGSSSASGNTPDGSDDSDSSATTSKLYGVGSHSTDTSEADSESSGSSSDDGDAMDMGLLIGIIAGGAVLLIAIAVALYFGCLKKKKKNNVGMAEWDEFNQTYKPPTDVKTNNTDDDIDQEKPRVY